MDTKLKLLIVTLTILIVGCKSAREVVYKPAGFHIEFGKSGGFTNVPMNYLINGDRKVFKHETDKYIYLKTISKQELANLKQILEKSEFSTLALNEPGNMTYFLKVKDNSYENNVQWNDQSDAESAKLIYHQLVELVKSKP